jgi:hypothetical protein
MKLFVAMAVICLLAIPALADSSRDAPTTKATEIHGLPGNNPGFGGASANPNGVGQGGGNGIHNVAGGAPGQSGNHPTTGNDGTQPSEDIHGGMAGAVPGHAKH